MTEPPASRAHSAPLSALASGAAESAASVSPAATPTTTSATAAATAASPSVSRAVRPRLIATDLDGTLLRDDKTVSARTVAALAGAEAAGFEVFFVTGRPARWMDVVSDHVHGHGLAICANGAAVVDLHRGGRVVEVRALHRYDALAVVRALREAAPGVSFAVESSGGIRFDPRYPALHADPRGATAPVEELLGAAGEGHEGHEGRDGREEHEEQPVLKLLAHHPELEPDEFLALGREAAGRHAQITRSSMSALLEISGRGVSKASTLAWCCAQRGVSPEEVVAFGDMPNDVEMLSWAGTSYAMANAHPDVLAATTHRTSSNESDGVAEVIERMLLRHGGPRSRRSESARGGAFGSGPGGRSEVVERARAAARPGPGGRRSPLHGPASD